MSDYPEMISCDPFYCKLSEQAEELYRFAALYSDGTFAPLPGVADGEPLNVVESHVLAAIAQNPGISISELAPMWNRTKGALSQTATKLERKGYIQRCRQGRNTKSVMLFPTELGVRLNRAQRKCNAVEISRKVEALLGMGCTQAEIEGFFKVVGKYLELL